MKKKIYAVKKGRKKGIFYTWEECRKQVDNFSNAEFKSFTALEMAQEFINDDNKNFEIKSLISYVDGSYDKLKKIYGSGIVFLEDPEEKTFSFAGNNKEYAKSRNVAGEISACIYAMEYAKENKYEKIIINHDYIGLEKWCTGSWKTNKIITKAYKNCCDYMCNFLIIKFNWIRGHSGDKHNEMADKLAKKALKDKKYIDVISKYSTLNKTF